MPTKDRGAGGRVTGPPARDVFARDAKERARHPGRRARGKVPSSRAQYIGRPAGLGEPFYPYYPGTDNHGVNDNKTSGLGPAPGFVVGGPNASDGGDATPPLGSVYPNRFYRDWNDQTVSTARTWGITENSISYQGPYGALGAYFMAAPRAAPLKLYTVPPCRLVDSAWREASWAPATTAASP